MESLIKTAAMIMARMTMRMVTNLTTATSMDMGTTITIITRCRAESGLHLR
jgi:hypothetical protein